MVALLQLHELGGVGGMCGVGALLSTKGLVGDSYVGDMGGLGCVGAMLSKDSVGGVGSV